MLKSLFNGSVILAASGFVLICSSSPDVSKSTITTVVDRVATFTAKHGTSLLPSYVSSAKCTDCHGYPYRLSLIGMHDYYNTIPSYGTFIR